MQHYLYIVLRTLLDFVIIFVSVIILNSQNGEALIKNIRVNYPNTRAIIAW